MSAEAIEKIEHRKSRKRLSREKAPAVAEEQLPAKQEELELHDKPIDRTPIVLPPRRSSLSTFITLSSSTLSYSGLLLGSFDSRGAKTARAVCNGLGFFAKQVHDGYINHQQRKAIDNKIDNLDDLSGKQSNKICPQPTEWYNNFGLTLDWKVILTTIINVALQLTVIAFASYDANQKDDDKFLDKTQYKIMLNICTLLAILLDQIEQHYKVSNLQRREEQLNRGIARF